MPGQLETQVPEQPDNRQPQGEGPLYAPESGLSLFLKLFIVPAGIVAVALGIFFLGTVALQNPKSPEDYLAELRSDSTTKRWQAAFELSRFINTEGGKSVSPELRGRLVTAFADAKGDDARVREYLALVLGSLKEKSAVEALSEGALKGEQKVRVNCLWALGNIEDPQGGPAALKALSDGDEGVQLMAVGALGSLRYAPARSALVGTLESGSRTLRFNSAVALSRLGDARAVPVLLEMLSLQAGEKEGEILQRSAKLAAIEASRDLDDKRLRAKVTELSRSEPDLKIRDAAMQALKK